MNIIKLFAVAFAALYVFTWLNSTSIEGDRPSFTQLVKDWAKPDSETLSDEDSLFVFKGMPGLFLKLLQGEPDNIAENPDGGEIWTFYPEDSGDIYKVTLNEWGFVTGYTKSYICVLGE